MLINRFCSASKGSLLWITYFLRPCGLGGNQELVFRLWFDIIPSLSPIWNGTTTLPPVSPVSHWSSLGWGGGCSLGPWADYLCLPSWSWFPSSYWVTLSLLRLRVCLWVECSCHFKWVYPVSPWSKIQCWCSERVLFIQSFLLTFNPGICGLYMDTRFQGPALRETTGYIYCWWSYSHILTWLLKKS